MVLMSENTVIFKWNCVNWKQLVSRVYLQFRFKTDSLWSRVTCDFYFVADEFLVLDQNFHHTFNLNKIVEDSPGTYTYYV